jgi:hypothetical protein
MSMSAFKTAIIGGVVIASVAAPLTVQHWCQVQWRKGNEQSRRQAERLADLSGESQRLSNLVAESERSSVANDQSRELLRLRGEIGRLRQTASEIATLRAKNQQLLAARNRPESQPVTSPPPDPRTVLAYWPKTQLAPAGYGDPASALQTVLWAMSHGDSDALAASVTPQARSALTRENWFDHGPPAEEMAAATRKIADSLNPSSGFYVVGQTVRSQDEAILNVYFEGEGRARNFAMKKIGDDWRFDNLGNGAWP